MRRAICPGRAIAVAAAAAVGLMPGPAYAGRNLNGVPGNLTERAASDNFTVHYTSTPGDPNAIAPEAAQQLLDDRRAGAGRLARAAAPAAARGRRRPAFRRLRIPRRTTRRARHLAGRYHGRSDERLDRHSTRCDGRHPHRRSPGGAPPAARALPPRGSVLAEGTATWAPLHLYAAEIGVLPDARAVLPRRPAGLRVGVALRPAGARRVAVLPAPDRAPWHPDRPRDLRPQPRARRVRPQAAFPRGARRLARGPPDGLASARSRSSPRPTWSAATSSTGSLGAATGRPSRSPTWRPGSAAAASARVP